MALKDFSRRPLSRRQNEVLRAMGEGKTNGEIAALLGISTGTVRKHAEHIYAKLGAGNRTQAVMLARLSGEG